MFTGIVESTGTVESIARAQPDHPAARLTVATTLDLSAVTIGAATGIAVDGVCLHGWSDARPAARAIRG